MPRSPGTDAWFINLVVWPQFPNPSSEVDKHSRLGRASRKTERCREAGNLFQTVLDHPHPEQTPLLSSAALHGAVRLRQNFPEIPWLVLLVLELALCPHGFLCSHAQSLLSCPTLCDPMDCSPPGSSVHGIFQAGILEWVAISSSRGSSHPRGQTCVSCIADGFFTTKPLGEALRLPTDEATACALYIEGEIPADMQRTSFLGVKLPPVFPALD